MTPEEQKEFIRRRNARNKVILLALFGFVVLFYLITIARMGG